ncbi:MAG: histidine--tRNA ligase [Acidobacteriota bacterium]
MASTNPARGMRDFLPADVRKRNYVIGIIKEVYESYGFEPLETPAVENLETLMGKYGDEGNQLVFKILKRGEKLDLENAKTENDLSDLALRYDLTVPLARVVANNKNDLPKFFKRYQIQPVWRADRPARGRFREFYQCDVDAIGSSSMAVEAELISAVSEILTRLKFKEFIVTLNHRKILTGILETSGIEKSFHVETLVSLDKLEKIGEAAVTNELAEKGISLKSILTCLQFINRLRSERNKQLETQPLEDANQETISKLRSFLANHDEGTKGVAEIDQVNRLVNDNGLESHVLVEPSLARGLSYYTGAIVEIEPKEGNFQGSVGGGGRYDGLIGMFGKEQIPACGFSLGLERILVVMEERGMFPPEIAESTPADVMVMLLGEESTAESLKLASEMRSAGLRVTVYPQNDKEDKQWKYANSIGVPFICSITEEDMATDTVSYQNLHTREKGRCSRSDVADRLRSKSLIA